MRPIELGRAVGLSAQSVRKYEQWGFIPPSDRSPSGYRKYSARHLDALRTARVMIAGYGWMPALKILQEVHRGNLTQAAALVDERHALLYRERKSLEEMLKALQTIAEAAIAHEEHTSPPGRRTLLTVGEAAKRVGARVSALRFWEDQGLLNPRRDRESGYRLYDEEEVRRLQIVAMLRKANYGWQAIQAVLAQLAAGRPQEALAAAQQRLRDLTATSRRCMAATAALHAYIEPSAKE